MEVQFSKKFKKKYKKLNDKIKDKFDDRLKLLMVDIQDQNLKLHPLKGLRKGQWSINVTADYRAIFIYVNMDTILFLDIGTHSELYK